MKSGVAAGAVAGVVASIVGVVFGFIGTLFLGAVPGSIEETVITSVVLTIVFGTIFGAMYSKVYDSIPGVGVSKGLRFGLVIWFIKDIVCGAYVGLVYRIIPTAIGLIFVGFFMWIAYGPVLGAVYKR